MTERRLVMVGNGMAGLACLDAILRHEPGWHVTVFGAEPRLGYNRILLSSLLAGECSAEDTITHDAAWYADRGVTLRAGVRVVALDRERRCVRDDTGAETPWDRLLLATGSEPTIPPIDGWKRPGVHVFRTLDDTSAILADARRARKAVVIGGGLLGLEAARGLAKRKLDVTVVHRMAWLMEQQLDAAAGALLRDAMHRLGIRVLLERNTLRVEGDGASEHGRVSGVVLEGDEKLDADLLVIATGIRPRVELARDAGLEVKRGIVVDDFLRTSDRSIFAVGECVEHRGKSYGLVAPLYEQGLSLAQALHGDESRPYLGSLVHSKLKVAGVNVLSVGRFTPSADAIVPRAEGTGPATRAGRVAAELGVSEALRVEDTGSGLYRKVLIENGVVVGAILMGQIEDGPRLVNLIAKGVPVGDEAERRALLLGSLAAGAATAAAEADESDAASALDENDTVCGCMGVSKGTIVAAIEAGATTFAELKRVTRAASSCGSCAGTCQALLRVTTGSGASVSGPIVLCECVPHTKEDLRRGIRNQELRSVSHVLRVYGNGTGCSSCRPSLAFLVDEVWEGRHTEERASRYVNDRVHANIQKDGTFSVVPRMRGGITSAAELRRIADVADKYAVPMVKVTGGQRIDLLGVRKQDLPSIWRDLGMPSGHAYAKAVRTVKTCVGTEFCRFGVGDSTHFGVRLEASTEGLHTPHKVKMGVTGCPRNCAEVTIKDIGVMAIQGGWEVYVGGAAGMRVRKADLLVRAEHESEALAAAHAFLQYYRENAEYLERTYDFVERIGIARIRAETVDASNAVRAALLERFQRSREIARDPWATDGNEPATAHQFGALPAVAAPGERGFVRVGMLDDVPLGEGRAVRVGRREIALFRTGAREVRAIQARCPHANGPLADGILAGSTVTCPLHGWKIDVATGDAASPAGNCDEVETYAVELRGDQIWIDVPGERRVADSLPAMRASRETGKRGSPCADDAGDSPTISCGRRGV